MTASLAPTNSDEQLSLLLNGSVPQGRVSQRGSLHVQEVRPGAEIIPGGHIAVMVTSHADPPAKDLERAAIDAVVDAVELPAIPLAERLTTGFRDANRLVYQSTGNGTAGLTMMALVAEGKYAAIGLVGEDRGYLVRAGRLTQVTRDQRVHTSRSRRKQDSDDQTDRTSKTADVALLGEKERLDGRSPAIFELTLLPEDRVAILSRGAAELTADGQLMEALTSGSAQPAARITESLEEAAVLPVMAAVLEVSPAREPVILVETFDRSRSIVWLLMASFIVLLAVAAVIVFFLVG